MFRNLMPWAVGIQNLDLADAIRLARQTGFDGVDFRMIETANLVDQRGIAYVQELFQQAGIRPGIWGLPISYRDDNWEEELAQLPRYARIGQELGCYRTGSGCRPGSDDLPYQENFAWHVARLRPIAQVLKDHGCSLGLEFIGPKTFRAAFTYEFIYDMEGMLELASAIGTGNVGLTLDAWHLYTSGGAMQDLDSLTPGDVVNVHVNDAPAGIPIDEQIDNVRCLPMETGVIDLPTFMGKLAKLGYDGPVTPEPFSQRVNDIVDPVEAARVTAASMEALWRASGLA